LIKSNGHLPGIPCPAKNPLAVMGGADHMTALHAVGENPSLAKRVNPRIWQTTRFVHGTEHHQALQHHIIP
jgi:hypothetical protein